MASYDHHVPPISSLSTPRHGFLGRVTRGMSGQVFSRAIQAAYSILLVPVMVRAWGVSGYGQWIALTALAAYMGLSNFGLITSSANEMVIAIGAGDIPRARLAFQLSINLVIYIVLPLILLIVAALSLIPLSDDLHLGQIDSRAVSTIILCSGATIWFQSLRGLMVAALYSTGSYGFAYYVQGGMKFLELLSLAAVVSLFGGGQVSAAAIIAVMALIEMSLIAIFARRAAPWARLDLRVFDIKWLQTQAKPTIGFMVSSFAAYPLMLQGPRVLLGALFGGEAVAIYAIYNTAMKFVDQLLLTFVMPLEVEIGRSSGRGDLARIYRLILAGTHLSWVLFVCVCAGLLLFGPFVFHIWTTGRVEFSYGLMALFMGVSAGNLLGRVSLHALISTNRLFKPSFLIMMFALLSLGLGVLLTKPFGMRGIVMGCIAGETANSIVVLGAVAAWLNIRPGTFANALLDIQSTLTEIRAWSRDVWFRLRPGVRL